MNYADAGVSLSRADEAMVGVKKSVRSTFNQCVLGDVGNFGGLFTLKHLGLKDPVLVSSVDGVGTKLKVDIEMNTPTLPGQDIVNHCCNDILVQCAAVNAAVNAFNKELIASHIRGCVARDIREGKDEVIDELVETLQKLMK